MSIAKNPKRYFWITLVQSANFLAPVITLFYLHRGLDYFQIFTLYAVLTLSMFAFEVPTGILGDKFGRKTSILMGLAGWSIFAIGLLFANSFWAFFILFILFGINVTFASGSDEALIYDSLKQARKTKEMKKHMGKILSARFFPIIILAPIASIIAKDLTSMQFNVLIIGNIITTIIAFFIALTLVEPKAQSGPHEIRSPLILFKESVKTIKKSPKLVRLFMNKTLILIPGMNLFGLLWQPYLKVSNVPIALFGFLISIAAIIVFFISRKLDKIEKYISDRKLLFYTGIIPLLAFIVGAIFKNIIAALLFYFIIKIIVSIRNPIFSPHINKYIKSRSRATTLSSLSMIDSFFDVFIFFSAGIITSIGIGYSFIFSAGLMAIALTFFRITDKQLKTQKRISQIR